MRHVIQLLQLRKALLSEFNIDEYILNSGDDVFGAIQLLVEADWVFDSGLSGVQVEWNGDEIVLSVDEARGDVNASLVELNRRLAQYA